MSLRFGFLMYPGYEELDLIGPWEIATMWHTYAGGPACVTVAQSLDEIRCAKGLITRADARCDTVGQLDYLLVPGGFAAFQEIDNASTVDFIAAQAPGCRAVLSVCTGSFLLEAAGLLRQRRAATNWKAIERLRGLGVEVLEQRYVNDGPLWTSAGVAAGIDMLLAFIAHESGAGAAWTTQYQAEYLPEGRLYGSTSDWDGAPAYARAPRA